ncbi:MAG: hypothetical protein KatS3mg083_308 [Candidatus Dojkabacteria bacterium]|nr:MAG: hypothetical protein KatS3mg083_308 [Candidatus Dojkabacteria bacterium]
MRVKLYPIKPKKEFGKPNNSACGESITLTQLNAELIEQDRWICGSFRRFTFSMLNIKEARSPVIEKIIIIIPTILWKFCLIILNSILIQFITYKMCIIITK